MNTVSLVVVQTKACWGKDVVDFHKVAILKGKFCFDCVANLFGYKKGKSWTRFEREEHSEN